MPYTFSEVYEASRAYFQQLGRFSEDTVNITAHAFTDKYALRNGEEFHELTPDDMHDRLASEFKRIEDKYSNPLSYDVIRHSLDKFKKILPQGSPMYGIGNPYAIVSLSNCQVLASPKDQLSGIMNTGRDMANLFKRRVGVGTDLSTLRPEGAPVRNSAKTSTGAWSFADLYSHICRSVGQNGRRGALMLTMSVEHPDIQKFITMKHDRTKVTGANVSVMLTDGFMEAVRDKGEWKLTFDGKTYGTISAEKLWYLICDSAAKTAEPGLVFIDNYRANMPLDFYKGFEIASTNPCQPSWATLLTPRGVRTFADVNVGDKIWSAEGWTTIIKKWSSGVKDVYKYETTAGEFIGTDTHRVVQNEIKVEAKDASTIDLCTGPLPAPTTLYIKDIMDGLMIGDGSRVPLSNGSIAERYLNIGEDDYDYFNSEISSLILVHRPGFHAKAYEVESTIVREELSPLPERVVPDRFVRGNSTKKLGFLRGLFSANGSVVGEGRITLKTTSLVLLKQVQLMLSSIGIRSYYTTNKSVKVQFSNGEYLCKESYDLNILKDASVFMRFIGFIQKYKVEKYASIVGKGKNKGRTKLSYEVKSSEKVSSEEVFHITVDNSSHTYWTGGLNVSNCAEQGLPADDTCRLLTMNLLGYVLNPFTNKAIFDWERFSEGCSVAMRLTDDLIDLELECLGNIKEKADTEDEKALFSRMIIKAEQGRRTGIGTHGLASALAALGLKYDDPGEARECIACIYKTLRDSTYRESVRLARQRGAFPIFDWNVEKNCEFIKRLPQDLQDEIRECGRRNGVLTNAPTGTSSLMSMTTSGIEPEYAFVSYRSKKVADEKNTRVDRVDAMGDKWTEYKVLSPTLQRYVDINGEPAELPEYFVTSSDIDWVERVKVQATIQEYLDSGISSTINLPKGTSTETVQTIYMEAWKSGLKGVTVYVDGCRDAVLKTESQVQQAEFYKRPQVLDCRVHQIRAKKEGSMHLYTVVVGLRDSKPFEVFAGDRIEEILDGSRGTLRKCKGAGNKSRYELEVGAFKVRDIVGSFGDSDFATVARLASLSLRNRAGVEHVVDQLLKETQPDFLSRTKVLARVLKEYITNGHRSGLNCPQCTSKELIFQEGCFVCKACGYSGCG